jgi:hypothetical protein
MTGKKITTLLLLFSLEIFAISASAGPVLASKQQIAMFKNTKTCVVMEGGIGFYSAAVKEAVQKLWKATEYEIIDQTEFDKRKIDPKYSFIVRMDGAYDKDPGGVSYSYISLVLGDSSGNLTKMPEFCSIPLTYTGDQATDYEYVIPVVIKFMQIHLKNLEKDRFAISLNGLKYYNKTGFKDKVLLLNKDKMASNSNNQEKVGKAYPFNFKLLTSSEIQDQILTNPPNTLFHFHVGPLEDQGSGKCFEMLFDADGNLYYFNSRKITNDNPDGFNLNDFNKIK